jgi:hypothetical protein
MSSSDAPGGLMGLGNESQQVPTPEKRVGLLISGLAKTHPRTSLPLVISLGETQSNSSSYHYSVNLESEFWRSHSWAISY